MRKKIFDYSPENIIEANLDLQTVQRSLSKDYKIYAPKVETLICNKFISIYKNWDQNKQENFIKTIAGKVNFKKVKNFFDEKTRSSI
jgi:hypothetical protein